MKQTLSHLLLMIGDNMYQVNDFLIIINNSEDWA